MLMKWLGKLHVNFACYSGITLQAALWVGFSGDMKKRDSSKGLFSSLSSLFPFSIPLFPPTIANLAKN